MKALYVTFKLDVIVFATEDVITSSADPAGEDKNWGIFEEA